MWLNAARPVGVAGAERGVRAQQGPCVLPPRPRNASHDWGARTLTSGAVQEPVVSVVCGKKFTIFATASGKVFGMGDNKNGELGSSAAGVCMCAAQALRARARKGRSRALARRSL